MIETLCDKEWPLRYESAKALGVFKDQRAVEPLIRCLRDSKRQVRISAAESLGKIGDPRAIIPLLSAADDADVNLRVCAMEALILLHYPFLSKRIFSINERGSRELREFMETVFLKLASSKEHK